MHASVMLCSASGLGVGVRRGIEIMTQLESGGTLHKGTRYLCDRRRSSRDDTAGSAGVGHRVRSVRVQ